MKPRQKTLAAACTVLLLGVLESALVRVDGLARVVSDQTVTKIDFRDDIQPLFREHCLSCHGPTQQLGGFRLDQRSSARKAPGRLQAGSSSTSRLYLRLIGTEFGVQMPPSGPLPLEQAVLIKAWIDQGAEWPDALAGDPPPLPQTDPATIRILHALKTGDLPAARMILRDHPRVAQLKDATGATPLMYAALYADAQAVRVLLEAGADPNSANEAGATALMWAVSDAEKTRLLLDYGADADARALQGQTPLSVAAGQFGSRPIVELLLDYGAEPSSSPRGGDPLLQAAIAGDAEVFQILVQHGANLKSAGAPALQMALRAGCWPCADLLIGSASPPSLNAALVALAPFGDARTMQALLDHGADLNAKVSGVRPDIAGRTPLMLAASSDLLPVDAVKLLIDRGADVNAKGPWGETALGLARRNGATPLVDLLTRSGAHDGDGFPTAHVTPKAAPSIRAALARSLPLLQRSDVTFLQKTGCVSCHHNTFTAMTIALARAHGIPIDEQAAQDQVQRIASALEARREAALLSTEISNTASNILVGLAAERHAPDLATDAMAHYLKTRQLPDGRWRNWLADHRPPIQGSDIEVTATSIRALDVYAPRPQRAHYQVAIRRAATWLTQVKPRTTDERALQLLGLHWAKVPASRDVIRNGARDLVAEQRSDGGWAQLPTLASDAYATGQALVALREATGLQVTDPIYRRGIRFLLDTQLDDGSWYVKTRSLPFQHYFESGFPHGPDQWISAAATGWASMALALAVP